MERGWKFLVTEIFFLAKTSSWRLKTKKKKRRGGILGFWGAPRIFLYKNLDKTIRHSQRGITDSTANWMWLSVI